LVLVSGLKTIFRIIAPINAHFTLIQSLQAI